MRTLIVTAALACLAGPVLAQERPGGWQLRLDRAGMSQENLRFEAMAPGFHLTTGPAGIFYHPDSVATGRYRLEATIHLFDPNGRNGEAFGIFFGGHDLDGAGQDYMYFLIRNTGSYLVKHRAGADTHTIVPWTETAAMETFQPGQEGTATNTLAVEVGPDGADFFLNGEKVQTLERAPMMRTDGVFGIRANHGLNLHVQSLAATARD